MVEWRVIKCKHLIKIICGKVSILKLRSLIVPSWLCSYTITIHEKWRLTWHVNVTPTSSSYLSSPLLKIIKAVYFFESQKDVLVHAIDLAKGTWTLEYSSTWQWPETIPLPWEPWYNSSYAVLMIIWLQVVKFIEKQSKNWTSVCTNSRVCHMEALKMWALPLHCSTWNSNTHFALFIHFYWHTFDISGFYRRKDLGL